MRARYLALLLALAALPAGCGGGSKNSATNEAAAAEISIPKISKRERTTLCRELPSQLARFKKAMHASESHTTNKNDAENALKTSETLRTTLIELNEEMPSEEGHVEDKRYAETLGQYVIALRDAVSTHELAPENYFHNNARPSACPRSWTG